MVDWLRMARHSNQRLARLAWVPENEREVIRARSESFVLASFDLEEFFERERLFLFLADFGSVL